MFKKNKLGFVFSILMVLLSVGFMAQRVHAEGAEFTMTPVYGKGQTDLKKGYFSIKPESGQTYPVTVTIQNLNTKDANQFDVQLVNASTSNDGQISYTPSNQKMVKTKAPMLKNLATQTKKTRIEIPASGSQQVTFNLKIPAKGFKGTILGSIYVNRIPKTDKTTKKMAIQNRFAMTMPIVLDQNPDKVIVPHLTLDTAKMISTTGVPKVTGRIANPQPTMFGQIKIHAWVTKRGQTKKLYQQKSEKYAMAPRSTFDYSIDLNNKLLPVGKYTMHTKITSGKKTFNLKRNFKVNAAAREQVNQKLNTPEKARTNWLLWGSLVGLLILVVALVAYLIGRAF